MGGGTVVGGALVGGGGGGVGGVGKDISTIASLPYLDEK